MLVLNDHVLKGAGLLPGWLTGKLSDFAGLIVAPVLAAALVCARRASLRFACVAGVGAGFAAIKVVPSAARALETALAFLHLPSRVWSDPTDLWALLVLPISWWLTGRPRLALPRLATVHRLLQPAMIAVAAFACMATSMVKSIPFETVDGAGRPFIGLENRTGRAVAIIDYYNNNDAAENCSAVLAGDFSSLSTRQFSVQPGGCLTLADGEVFPFGSFDVEAPSDAELRPPKCKSVAFRAAGLPDTVVIWQDPAPPSTNPDQLRVFLDTAGTGLTITGSEFVHSWPAKFTLVNAPCASGP